MFHKHYNDDKMSSIASQITSLAVVYSTVYSDTDQRKHQSSVWLAFVWGIHRDRWNPRTQGQLRGKCFHLMTSSWKPEEGWGSVMLSWWRYQMETFSALLAVCEGNPPVTDRSLSQRPEWRGALLCAWKNGWANNGDAVICDAIALIMTLL